MITNECGAVVGMRIGVETETLVENLDCVTALSTIHPT
jgi:hypothetical protein